MNEYDSKNFKEKLIMANFKLFYYLYHEYSPNLIEELILGIFELMQILSTSFAPIVRIFLIFNIVYKILEKKYII